MENDPAIIFTDYCSALLEVGSKVLYVNENNRVFSLGKVLKSNIEGSIIEVREPGWEDVDFCSNKTYRKCIGLKGIYWEGNPGIIESRKNWINNRREKMGFFFEVACSELGQEILTARPKILSAISRIKRVNPEAKTLVISYSNRHVFYQQADSFIGLGYRNSDSHFSPGGYLGYNKKREEVISECIKNYEKVDFYVEETGNGAFDLPKIDKWKDVAKSIITPPYVSISARKRTEEGYRNFAQWPWVVDDLSVKGLKIICTTPRSGAPEMNVPYLEDFIGKENEDSVGIEMAIHNGADLCITSNTGAAGIMLLSNPDKMLIFGGVGGFSPGWDGMHSYLSSNDGYRTKFIDSKLTFVANGTKKDEDTVVGLIRMVTEILGRQS